MTDYTLPRDKVARALRALARGDSPANLADTLGVQLEVAHALLNTYGPDAGDLREAAKTFERASAQTSPASPEQVAELVAEVCPPMPAPARYYDHLTGPERRACRAWAGLPVSSHNVPRAALDAWTAAGRPVPTEPRPEEDEPQADVEHGGSRDAQDRWIAQVAAVEADLAAKATSSRDDAQVEVEPAVDAPSQDGGELHDDLLAEAHVHAVRWCQCGAAPAGTCAACDPGDGEPCPNRVEAALEASAVDWGRLYTECLQIPELALECRAVADAVEMLRDARAEHEHREALVVRIGDVIRDAADHSERYTDTARRILDAIEAA